ncbi:MAG TPA: SGNH/GDSL hydrolase family protein [Kiritimatiellia bacterium]|nr:SGNH/GDSL hydrolase family protein [Kiritimatiellia bacterium]HRZ12862.1 SGNH/GDSL hydrolase family protein [Kiritimatiellia bacterium]
MNDQNVMMMFSIGALAMTALALAYGAHGHRHVRPRWVCLVIANLLLGLWLVAVGLLAGEVYFRHFLDMTDSFAISRVHQAWLHRHWTLNKQGIRDTLQSYTLKPAPGKERIVFLGDSFTAGHGIRNVDHRFANLYRAMHAEKEVHVLAHSGWDTGDFLNCLQDFKRQGYVFGEVVLISGLNDISDIDPAWQRMTAQVKDSFKPSGILQNSYLLNWLYFRMKVVTSPAFRDYGLGVQERVRGPGVERTENEDAYTTRHRPVSRGPIGGRHASLFQLPGRNISFHGDSRATG